MPKKPKKNVKLKKQFETLWSETAVLVLDKLTLAQQQHFDGFHEISRDHDIRSAKRLIHPDHIPFRELFAFLGKRTRITIEVLE